MNIIKRIGVAFDLVVFGNLTPDQATDIFPLVKKSLAITEHLQELQRRSQKLAYIEGVGYELKQPSNPALATPVKPAPEPNDPRRVERNNRRGSVQDAVVRCIDNIQTRYYTSTDVWREYQLMNCPKTTRGTVLACVTYLRETGAIQAANPPRKIGNQIVHQK